MVKVNTCFDSQTGFKDRQKHLRRALGSAALEGVTPRPQALADLQAVAGGTMTNDQYRQRVKQRYGIQG